MQRLLTITGLDAPIRSIIRGLYYGSAIGVGFVLAQYAEQWYRTKDFLGR